MRATRIAWATAGLLLGGFGVFRLVTEIPLTNLMALAAWLVAAVMVHDLVLAPAVVAIGWLFARAVPPRARRYLQGAGIASGLIALVAVPMMYRAGSEPASKALLQQSYGRNLTLLVGVVAAVSLLMYAVRVGRDHRAAGVEPRQLDPPDS